MEKQNNPAEGEHLIVQVPNPKYRLVMNKLNMETIKASVKEPNAASSKKIAVIG